MPKGYLLTFAAAWTLSILRYKNFGIKKGGVDQKTITRNEAEDGRFLKQ